jgi:hypothetical protein
MLLFKFVTNLIKLVSCLPSTKNSKNTNESNLKAIEASKNILCNYAWVNLIVCTKSMTKESHACASLIKFFMVLKIKTMQTRFKRVSTLITCFKLGATT